jgi:hypothetical protein
MILTLTAAAAGTGVTTTAVGLAAVWPRPVLLVEADPAGWSTILAGTLAARVPVGAGVLDAAMAARAGDLDRALPGMLVDLPGTQAQVLPGLSGVAQRRSLTPAVWLDLAAELRGWAQRADRDLIIDTGALTDAAHPAALHPLADLVLLVTRLDLVGVSSARNWSDELAATLPDPARLHLLSTGHHPAYTAPQVAAYLSLPLLGDLGHDPITAGHYSRGLPLPRRHRGALTRSLPAAAATIRALAPEGAEHV